MEMFTKAFYTFIIPVLIGLVLTGITFLIMKKQGKNNNTRKIIITTTTITLLLMLFMGMFGSNVIWHYEQEIPSVEYKNVTIEDIQPQPNVEVNEYGNPIIDNADDLIFITTDGQTFQNTKVPWWSSFEKTGNREIFIQLKPGGTYEIEYYGWRDSQTNTFPNIIQVTKVINESGTVPNSYSKYFGNNQ